MSPSEIDNLLAAKLFGWKMQGDQLMPPQYYVPRGTTAASMTPPKYSSEPIEARKVWDKVVEMGGDKYDRFLSEMPNLVAQRVQPGQKIRHPGELIPPMEICMAAIKALELA